MGIKDIFLYILALVVLLAPAIILGWIGWTLLEWPGLIIGVVGGLAIFIYSMNKIQAQEAANESEAETASPLKIEETANQD